jgi:hypothetical protein
MPWSFVVFRNQSQYPIIIECKTIFDDTPGTFENINGILYKRIEIEKKQRTLGVYWVSEPVSVAPNGKIIMLRTNTVDFVNELGFSNPESDNNQRINDAVVAIDSIFSEINVYSERDHVLLIDKNHILAKNMIDLTKTSLPSAVDVNIVFTMYQ